MKIRNSIAFFELLGKFRKIVQIIALCLFIYLLLRTKQNIILLLPPDLFLRLDPLIALTMVTCVHISYFMKLMMLGGFILILTFVLGRVWCSWICPLGTILDLMPSKNSKTNSFGFYYGWRNIKYYLLFLILFTATLGSLTFVILDPITLLYRSLTSLVIPGYSLIITSLEKSLLRIELLRPRVFLFDDLVRGPLLTEQPFFLPNLFLGILLTVVLGLNFVQKQFWCRYICPLAGLLGLISSFSIIKHKVNQRKCISCHQCSNICPTGAIDPNQNFAAKNAECTFCFDCIKICPTNAIIFEKSLKRTKYQQERRQFFNHLAILTAGVISLNMLLLFSDKSSQFVRPPGTNEKKLLNRCIRCGECVRICPTGVIQPNYSLSNLNGIWTPILNTQIGYCDYSCNSCGQICPTGAINKIPLEDKQKTKIGIARIYKKRCIPWAEGRECIVCEEMCPVPEKAIKLEKKTVVNIYDKVATVLHPKVISELCIGCGICEYKCPVEGERAIRIFPPNVII